MKTNLSFYIGGFMGVIENSLLEDSESDTETWRMLVIIKTIGQANA